MYSSINGLKIYYEVAGSGKPIVLLHGWGGQVESFKPVFAHLAKTYKVCALDLPGFGRSEMPPESWNVGSYTLFLTSFLESVGIDKASIVAHSFGGRIAIMLAATFPEKVEKLILVDSAGIRLKGIKYYRRVFLAKTGRFLFHLFGKKGEKAKQILYRFAGSKDYLEAGKMRGTLVKVVSEDLRSILPKIVAPTLLVWGEHDTETPLVHGKIMQKAIKDSGLVVLKKAGHFSYLDQFSQFCLILSNFLGS